MGIIKTYRDPITDKPATCPHHIFGGRYRKITEKYKIVIWVDYESHVDAHKDIKASGKKYCKILGLSYNNTIRALEGREYDFLEKAGKRCKKEAEKYVM